MAAKHLVKCLYCGQQFDINQEPFIKPRANRYAHAECHLKADANKTQEEKDYEQLVNYIKHLFGKPNPRVWKQLKEFKEAYNYTYSGMYKTLVWWFEIKHGDIDKANGGIGILPYVYDDALKYYYALYLAQMANQNKDIAHLGSQVKEFTIEIPCPQRQSRKLFKFREDEK